MRLSAILLLLLAFTLAAPSRVDTAKTFGNPAAPITLELFSDYQCPACRAFHMQILPPLMREFVFPGRAYLVYKEFPLNQHSHAKEAATYAVAAARVGKYEQVGDALFQNQNTWEASGKIFDSIASALTPAEQKKVQALVKDPSVISEVDQDVQEGMLERVNETPTMIIIRGQKKYPIAGPPNYTFLRSLLNDLAK
ncbi:MAG TPA: thioredoxin domain-containing protein [Bryobacteraceae bacterium]|nr:thioredoxin domain-containing protein [Bryobacteraceae bacterium]